MQYGELKGAEGVAFDKAKEEIHITTKEELLVDIQIYLASKAAEIVFLGTETTGMGGDLPGASYRAVQYVRCGMGGQLFTMWGEMPTPQERTQAERVMQQQFQAARRWSRRTSRRSTPSSRRCSRRKSCSATRSRRSWRGSTARSGAPLAGSSICRRRTPARADGAAGRPAVAAAAVRYAGARRPSEERERERGDQGMAYRESTHRRRRPTRRRRTRGTARSALVRPLVPGRPIETGQVCDGDASPAPARLFQSMRTSRSPGGRPCR